MKNFITAFVSLLAMFYLLGSFITASFNIAEWEFHVRGWIGVSGLLFAFMAAGITHDAVKTNKK